MHNKTLLLHHTNSNKAVLKTLPNLNPLRFILAFLVILFHVPQFFMNRGLPYYNDMPIFNKGTEAVYVFFALSGYLIIRLLFHEKTTSKNINIKSFYIRRVLRIFPLYFLVLFSGLIYYNVFLKYIGIDLDHNYNIIEVLAYYIFFLPNIGAVLHSPGGALEILWSIGIEEQFYILVAPLLFLLKKKYVIPFFISFTFIYFLVFALNCFSFIAEYDFLYFYLSAGGAMGVIDLKYHFGKKLKAYYQYLILICFVLFFLLDFGSLSKITIHLIGMILFPLTILSLSVHPPFIIKSKLINYLGKISYGIYMYHAFSMQAVGFFILEMNIANLSSSLVIFLSFFLVVAITIIVAHVSYFAFEKKFISMKSKYR